MLFVQVAADFELDILALAERAEEEEQGLEEKRRVEEAVQDVITVMLWTPWVFLSRGLTSCRASC